MRSIVTAVTLALSLSVGALAAKAETVSLRVSATPSFYGDMYRSLIAEFEKQHPNIKIELDLPPGDQTNMLQVTLRQAVVNDLPDVSFQGFNFLQTLVEQKLPVTLGDFIASDPEWTTANYSQSVSSSATIQGNVVGLGVATAFPIIYYNADLVAEAQDGDPKLPADWTGILSVANRIQERHPNVLGLYTRYNHFIFQGHLDSRGGHMMSEDGQTATFMEQPGQEAAALLRQIGEAGQAKADMTLDQLQQGFVNGSIAININSSSSIAGLQEKIGASFKMGTAMLPMLSSDAALPTAGVASVMFTRDEAKQKAAWEFMKYVSSGEGQVIVGRSTGYVPANTIAVKDEELLGDYYSSNPAMQAALDSVSYATTWYAFPGSKSAMLETLVEDKLREIVTLRKTPQEVLAELQQEILAAQTN